MALVDNAWYVNYGNGTSTGYYAVAQWTAATLYAAGALVRQLAAPAVGSERVFVCVVAGTTLASEPSWTLTRGATTAEAAGPTWQECTGIAALNGDATNTPSWTITATPPGGVKNTAVTKGQVIKRDSGASYQICTTAGTAGNGAEPAFSNTAGTTTADNTVTWTSLGVVGNFTGWQAPHARIASAFTATWGQANNSFFVASEHAETQGSAITVVSPSVVTSTGPNFVYCVTKTAVPPVSANLTTGASIATTGNFAITFTSGWAYYYGITFKLGSGAVNPLLNIGTGAHFLSFDACALQIVATGAANIILGNANNTTQSTVILNNTTLQFGATSQWIGPRGRCIWKNTPSAITGATFPTTLFRNSGQCGYPFLVTGVDMSAIGAGATLVTSVDTTQQYILTDCKIPASAVVLTGNSNTPGVEVILVRCDSAAANYRHEKYNGFGSQVVETTIVRTGGATDGTTLVSWKIVTLSISKWVAPYESLPITIWNDSTSAINTLTIYGTTTGGGVPNNDDIWVEVEYLSSSLTPQGAFITTTKSSNLAASVTTNNSSDGATWGGGGAGNGFKMVVPSFTPGMKGPLKITINVAKASTTYYIDPRPEISGVTVSKSAILSPGVYANDSATMKYRNLMRGNVG